MTLNNNEDKSRVIDINMLHFFAARVVDGKQNKDVVFDTMIEGINKRKKYPIRGYDLERYYTAFETALNSMYRIRRMFQDELRYIN